MATVEQLVAAGRYALGYFENSGDCLFCDVDAERKPGGEPVHEGFCPFAPIPPCAAFMGCLCAGHARGNPADAACDTSEQ